MQGWKRDPCSGGAKEGQVLVPTRQKIIMSQKWGFTKFSQANYVKWTQENRIVSDGVNAKLLGCHGPLAQRKPSRAFLSGSIESTA